MKKFKFLIKYGLKKRIMKKSFLIVNILLGLVIIAVVNVPSIITMFSSDEVEDPTRIYVENLTQDEHYPLTENLSAYYNAPYEEPRYEVVVGSFDDEEAFWDQSEVDVWLVFSGDLNQPDVSIYSKEADINSFLIGQTQTFLNDYQGIEFANYLVQDPPASTDPGDAIAPEDRMFIEGIVSVLFLPVFILIIMATQMLGVDIIEEKSTKAIEIIIASVPAKYHFLSKIIANMGFLIIQTLIFVGFGALGVLVGNVIFTSSSGTDITLLAELASRIPNWPSILVMSILFLMVGTLLFLTLAALIASIATTQEDYQQFQAPMVFLLLGGYYIGIFLPILGFDGVLRVAAYIPFLSTLVAPIAFATGIISLVEIIIIFVFMAATATLFMYLVAPVYRIAILSYEETKFFKRIKLYIKKAFSKKTA